MLRPYYIDLSFKDIQDKEMTKNYIWDENGIPQYKYPFGNYYNISFICHYGLVEFERYLKYKNQAAKTNFIKITNWVINNGIETEDSFIFQYQFPFRKIKPPWISGLGQSRIISLLIRMYDLSHEEKYLNIAKKAFFPLTIKVNNGGLQSHFPDGSIAIEEFPHQETNIALNGFISSIFGIYDLAFYFEPANHLFTQTIESLKRNLHLFDLGFWSAYDLSSPIRLVANEEYHFYHIGQLWVLYEMTNEQIFWDYSVKWKKYKPNLYYKFRRAISIINNRLKYKYIK